MANKEMDIERDLEKDIEKDLKKDLEKNDTLVNGTDEAESNAGANNASKESADGNETASACSDAEKSSEEQESERFARLMAEFQNYKKRTAKEKSDIHAYGNEKLVADLLPVFDNFERALSTNASDDPEAYAQGMKLIFDQMKEAVTKAGVEEISAEGEEFDPGIHNAVMTEESEEHETGKVTKVLQKGYKLNSKVVRPSMVVVAK